MTNTPFGFSLANIQTLQFALFEENRSKKDSDEFTINTDLEFGISTEERAVRIQLGFLMEQRKKPQIKIEVSCDFILDESTWHSCCDQNEIVLPVGFMRHLTQISIGAIRGILHARTRETQYHDFLFPLFDVGNLIREDVLFSLAEDE